MAIKTTAAERVALNGDTISQADLNSQIEKTQEQAKKILAKFMENRRNK